MDQQPEKQLVRLIIPSSEEPDAIFVTDRIGGFPHEVTDVSRDHHEVSRELGARIVGETALAVVRADVKYLTDHTSARVKVAEIHTEPIDPANVPLSGNHRWNKI